MIVKDKPPIIPRPPKYRNVITSWEFFEMIICCRNKVKKDLYLKAEKKIFYNIDIFTYIKRMQEIEIMKYMLLDEKSLKIMNFISKPGVAYIDKGWGLKNFSSKSIYFIISISCMRFI